MLSKPLVAFATAYDFETDEEYAYGEIDGYLVSVYNTGTKKTAYISCCFSSNDESEEIDTFAFSADIANIIDAEGNKPKEYEIGDDYILFTTGEDLKAFDGIVTKIIELLKQHKAKGAEVCACCGDESTKLVIDKKRAKYLCDACASSYQDEAANASKPVSKLLKGTLFSILGSVLGTLLFIAAIIWLIPEDGIWDMHPLMISLPFVVVLTVLSFLLYRLSTGRKGMERILPCLISSLVFTAASVYLSTSVLYAKDMGVQSFARASKAISIILGAPISDPLYKSDFLTHLFYSLVIVIITVLIYSIVFEEKNNTPTKVISLAHSDDSCESEASED